MWFWQWGRQLSLLTRKVSIIMSTIAEEAAKVKALEDKFDAKWAETGTKFDTIKAEVQTLKDQIAAGTPPDTTALDAALAEFDDHLTNAAIPSE